MDIYDSNHKPKPSPKVNAKVWWGIGIGAALLIFFASQGSTSQPSNQTVNFQQTNQSANSTPSDTQTDNSSNVNVDSSTVTPAPTVTQQPTCTNGSYVNSDGNTVCSPEANSTVPTGATAQCVDGTYSFSQHRSGTCSHHGGVAQWL